MRGKQPDRFPDPSSELSEAYFSATIEDLSALLADVRKFPIILVSGNSIGAMPVLYRLLPVASYRAYAEFDKDAAFARPAVVRLVTHETASFGPQVCAQRGAFVDVLQTPGPSSPAAENTNESADGRDTAVPEELEWPSLTKKARQASARAYTEQFLSGLESSAFLGYGVADPSSPAGIAEPLCDGDRAETSADAASPVDTKTHVDAAEADGGSEADGAWVHWVVPLLLDDPSSSACEVLREWKMLLSGTLKRETATVVLFSNSDASATGSLVGCGVSSSAGLSRKAEKEAVFASHTSSTSTAVWGCVPRTSLLGQVLWDVVAGSPLLEKVCVEVSAQEPHTAPLQGDLSRDLQERRTALPVDDKAPPLLRLPCLFCFRSVSSIFGFGGSVVARVLSVVRQLESVQHKRVRVRGSTKLERVSVDAGRRRVNFQVWTPSWQWLLPGGGSRSTTPAPASCVVYKAKSDAPVFPYILVHTAQEQRAELRRAVRRNAVNAAALRFMQASAQTIGDTLQDTAPQPRYYAPTVVDGGSPLTVDGCLSDIFVLEFVPAQAVDRSWESWTLWLLTHPPSSHVARAQRMRYQVSLRLIKATKRYLATPLPRRDAAEALLQLVREYLLWSRRRRSILTWPVIDHREGHCRLRVAFVMTYEYNSSPFSPRDNVNVGSVADESAAHKSSASTHAHQHSLAFSIAAILRPLRSFGWVLVWQEDHRRWPTAVAPPCMCTAVTKTHSPYFHADSSWAMGDASAKLKTRMAVVLEEWRQRQWLEYKVQYDVDPATLSKGSLSAAAAQAERTALAESSRQVLHTPHHPSPYTSLDVWQAGVVPAEAGMYLWKGQTVILDSGQWGTIVDFKPPPTKLLVPWTSHPTEEERRRWRGQQQRHAAFVRFHRWRRRLLDDDAHPHRLAAAFTALPPHVVERELDVYPVVRIDSSCAAPEHSKGKLLHVLPTRVESVPINYPSWCAVSVQEQEAWLAAHPRAARPRHPLKDELWRLTMTDHRHANALTILSLPLSPHRVETCASFLVSRMLSMAQHPLRVSRLPFTFASAFATRHKDAVESVCHEWARLHRDVSQGRGPVLLEASVYDRRSGVVPFGHIRWSSFFTTPKKTPLPFFRK